MGFSGVPQIIELQSALELVEPLDPELREAELTPPPGGGVGPGSSSQGGGRVGG